MNNLQFVWDRSQFTNAPAKNKQTNKKKKKEKKEVKFHNSTIPKFQTTVSVDTETLFKVLVVKNKMIWKQNNLISIIFTFTKKKCFLGLHYMLPSMSN